MAELCTVTLIPENAPWALVTAAATSAASKSRATPQIRPGAELGQVNLHVAEDGSTQRRPASETIELAVIDCGRRPHSALRNWGQRGCPCVRRQTERVIHCGRCAGIIDIAGGVVER